MTQKFTFTKQDIATPDGDKAVHELFTRMQPELGMAAAIPYEFQDGCRRKLIKLSRELMDRNSSLTFGEAAARVVRDHEHIAYFALQGAVTPGQELDMEVQEAA